MEAWVSVISNILLVLAAIAFCLISFFRYRFSRLEYLRLESSLQHERYSHRLLIDVMRAIEDSLSDGSRAGIEIDDQTIYDSIMFAACRGTRAMSVCIFKPSPDKKRLVPVVSTGLFPFLEGFPLAAKNASPSELVRLYFRGDTYSMNSPIFEEALRTRRASLLFHFPTRPGRCKLPNAPAQPKSVIVVPAYDSSQELWGLIAIANPRHRGVFTEYEIKLADALAQQAVSAFETRNLFSVRAEKQRIDANLGIAAEVQRLLLPQYIPQAHSLDIAAKYVPAERIGGDLYDVFDMGGDRVAAIVADVAGHGVSAALLMAICRTNFQHIASKCTGAADLLTQLSRAMSKSFPRGKFLTIVCAIIDTTRGTLTLARGGHERPLLYTANVQNHKVVGCKSIEFIDSKGVGLGIVKPEIFAGTVTEVVRPYKIGDVVVLYTDGLTEATNAAGEEFGTSRLAAIVAQNGGKTARELNAAVVAALREFTGHDKFFDDLTLVSIRSV